MKQKCGGCSTIELSSRPCVSVGSCRMRRRKRVELIVSSKISPTSSRGIVTKSKLVIAKDPLFVRGKADISTF